MPTSLNWSQPYDCAQVLPNCSEFIRINNLIPELQRFANAPCPSGPRELVSLAARGLIPLAQQGPRRLWGAWRSDIPEIAARLGMLRRDAEQPAGQPPAEIAA